MPTVKHLKSVGTTPRISVDAKTGLFVGAQVTEGFQFFGSVLFLSHLKLENVKMIQTESEILVPDPFRNTTSNMGGDPHFTVRLSSGHLLCYSVQGEPGSIFNLISSKDLEINALFIPQKKQTKTWLGVIGVVVNGRKLVFNVTSGTIQMDDSMKMEANLVEKIKLTSGKFYLTMMTGRARARHVEVDLAEFDVRFLIVFVGRQHLDLVWFSGGIEDKGSFHGLIGECLEKNNTNCSVHV